MNIASLNNQFYQWTLQANTYLNDQTQIQERVFFPGSFVTGDLDNAEILLLSINPGGNVDVNVASALPVSTPPPLKYIQEYKDKYPFAQIMVSNLCVDKTERMNKMAESYLLCPFPSTDEKAWLTLYSNLPSTLREQFSRIQTEAVSYLLEKFSDRAIVVSGKANFSSAVALLKRMERANKESTPVNIKSCIQKLELSNGNIIYGLFHFSRDPSEQVYNETREFCAGFWDDGAFKP
ncbi:hypothetical protein [Aurantivibrio plasticivorans]